MKVAVGGGADGDCGGSQPGGGFWGGYGGYWGVVYEVRAGRGDGGGCDGPGRPLPQIACTRGMLLDWW